MGGKWRCNCCFAGCFLQDLLTIARNSLEQFPSNYFYIHFVRVHVVHPYSSIDTTVARKKPRSNLSDRSNFHMIDGASIAVHVFTRHILLSLLVDETMCPCYDNFLINFRERPIWVEMSPSWFKHMYSVLFVFKWRPMPPATYSWRCSRDSACVGAFARRPLSFA